ncbi:MAG: hypothetical protein R3F60_13780 [bacterium]
MKLEEIQQRLKAAAADPRAFMKQRPQKWDEAGNPAPEQSAFSPVDIERKRFIAGGDDVRRSIFAVEDGVVVALEDVLPGRAPFESNDRAENLVDTLSHRTLEAMDAAGLKAARLAENPWSDDYWAICTGQLGKRYADRNFPTSLEWEAAHHYVLDHTAADIVASGDAAAIDALSPAEKYDLLVGDTAFTLTRYMWEQGRYYFEKNGEVETWMGICHGWAPASYMLGRPLAPVTVAAADGQTRITFHPADIKALASQLWARSRTVSKFIGGRCNDKDPAEDANGRVTSPRCFDTNPGTWHLAVVNQIGVSKRSFVIDATYDYEVWNQPVVAYAYDLFHPVTRAVGSPSETIVPIGQLGEDRFKPYRSANAAYVVGVHMRLSYIAETNPRHQQADGPENDRVRTVEYIYDLELDANRQIIGGEWHQQAHPDFLWTPPAGVKAISPADRFSPGTWASGTVPFLWRVAARNGASQGLPLARVVEALISRARRPDLVG